MRRDAVPAERKLWQKLRNCRIDGLKFRRQAPLGPYIANFYGPAAALVIELDGISHLSSAEQDARRDAWLRARGMRVLRFANADVLGNLEGVITAIQAFVRSTPPPIALPQGEGEGSVAPSSLNSHSHV